jgi:uncharacterized phiE125 gp8 family phage protein
MRLEPLAAVAVEPVSLAQAKLWLRVDHDAEDGLITALISAARDYVEAQTGLALAPQTWRLAVRPSALPVELPRSPFGTLLSAEALLGDGTTRAVPLGDLLAVGVEPALVALRQGAALPADSIELRLEYASALPAGAPPRAMQVMRLLIAHWYEHREAAVDSTDEFREPPYSATALLDTLKIMRL